MSALEYIHQMNRLHRDIKSDNVGTISYCFDHYLQILLGRGGVFKLADFGAAIQLTDGQLAVKSFVGSPYWVQNPVFVFIHKITDGS